MHERNESMVSMKDVAVECGVSIATVSKALNDHSDISEETRRKVKEAANRLGYYPNSAARALNRFRSFTITHIRYKCKHFCKFYLFFYKL